MFVDGELCQVDPRFASQMQATLQAAQSRLVAMNLGPLESENTMVSEITADGVALLNLDGPLVRWESALAANYPVLQRDLQKLEAAGSVCVNRCIQQTYCGVCRRLYDVSGVSAGVSL